MTVLVSCGDGIGNIIQTTPLLRALEGLGETIDVYLYSATIQSLDLLRSRTGAPEAVPPPFNSLGRVSNRPQAFMGRHYTVAMRTWLCPFPQRMMADKHLTGVAPCSGQVSEAQAALNMAIELGYEGEMPPTGCSYQIPDWFEFSGNHWLAIHGGGKPFGRWLCKRLPPARYGEVCRILLERHSDLEIVVVGTKHDDLPELTHDRLYDVRGRGSLLEHIGIMHECDVFLGNDAGLGHCAAAVGTPAEIIYGLGEIRKNLPPNNARPVVLDPPLKCQPCQVKGKIECENECLTQLTTQEIVRAVEDHLPSC
jgi:ADP-heptose:LPS heptosyltransferase